MGRNSLLLNVALIVFPFKTGLISLGIHSGTNYSDCTEKFIVEMQDIFNIYTNGRIQIDAPFLKWNKNQIWEFLKSQNVPLHFTYSCELGEKQPCGKCKSCNDLEVLYAGKK